MLIGRKFLNEDIYTEVFNLQDKGLDRLLHDRHCCSYREGKKLRSENDFGFSLLNFLGFWGIGYSLVIENQASGISHLLSAISVHKAS
jgi:hypothetical protein